mgnify:FL=1
MSSRRYELRKAISPKKWEITTPEGKKIKFGSAGMSDYTINKSQSRKNAYISRHKTRENWTKSGINSAGFWSRWISWSQPTLTESIKYVNNKFNIQVVKM